MISVRTLLGVLILVALSTAADAVDCRSSGGKTWRMIEGKRCWYDGRRVSKHRLRWAMVVPAKPAKERPASRQPPIVPTSAPSTDMAMTFDHRFRIITPEVATGAGETLPPQTAFATEMVPLPFRFAFASAAMNGLMMFVLMMGVLLLFATIMLAIGLFLEARTRSRWDLRALRSLTTPPNLLEWTPSKEAR